jgi:3-deoxy-D-manno-octulosonate 8-phosphate phosphatase (KDO 8-P phosphatase)
MSSVAIVIPARHASTRLPGKPLLEIAGKTMIQHVFERASAVRGSPRVVVAVDDPRVLKTVQNFGGEAIMTDPGHPSGTDRLVEVLQSVDAEIYVNLQGDEPLLRSRDVEILIQGMEENPSVDVGTLCHAISPAEAENPNAVKVVQDADGNALIFSRARIPFDRDATGRAKYFKHVGIYAYRKEVLANYAGLPVPMLEDVEKLEQLRLLYAGYKIRVWKIEPTGPGVDTPECLEKVRRIFGALPAN